MKIGAFIFLLLAGLFAIGALSHGDNDHRATAANLLVTGDMATVKTRWAACRKIDDLRRVIDLAVGQHDGEAATRYAVAHDCKVMHKGDTVTVEDHSVWSNQSCLRLRGEPFCYWFPNAFVEKLSGGR